MNKKELVKYLDEYLRISDFKDDSKNGLQTAQKASDGAGIKPEPRWSRTNRKYWYIYGYHDNLWSKRLYSFAFRRFLKLDEVSINFGWSCSEIWEWPIRRKRSLESGVSKKMDKHPIKMRWQFYSYALCFFLWQL